MNAPNSTGALAPGATIGILGGGQLGRMTAMAAAKLGYDVHVFCPERDSPAARVAAHRTEASYEDHEALAHFAESIDVATFEFENVPYESVRILTEQVPVRPGWDALRVSQDRRIEKDFIRSCGVGTADFGKVVSIEDLETAVAMIGRPCILKSARLGYDGKGQVAIGANTDLPEAWRRMGADAGIVEARIAFDREISVVVARGLDGSSAAYDPVENRHVEHILDTTIASAPISRALAQEARQIAIGLAERLDIVGLLAVEMFIAGEEHILVNEFAPRPHNSGHWTIDACLTSQFEQFVRAVCGLPLGSTERHSDAVMNNLIGEAVSDYPSLLADSSASVHLYGKAEVRAGRKMGHVTRLSPRRDI